MATTLPWNPLLSPKPLRLHHTHKPLTTRRTVAPVRAFGRGDFDRFAKRMASGEVWRDVLRSTNDGFEQLVYETKKTAEHIDRRFSVSRRLSAVAQSASYRAREIDRDLEITQRLRTFSLDFSYNWPRYRKQLNDFWNTPLGRSFAGMIPQQTRRYRGTTVSVVFCEQPLCAFFGKRFGLSPIHLFQWYSGSSHFVHLLPKTIFFIWFALSGWMFRFLIFGTWILPFAGPLLIGTVANNFIIKGSCPACKKQFAGYKNQIVRCTSCGNIVWQPQGDFFSRGGRGTTPSSSKSDPEIIDVEFEEK